MVAEGGSVPLLVNLEMPDSPHGENVDDNHVSLFDDFWLRTTLFRFALLYTENSLKIVLLNVIHNNFQ